MKDMNEEDIVGTGNETTLQLYQGGQRKVFVVDEEEPYPDGCLIVSRTDVEGNITHCNDSFVRMSGYCEDEIIGQPHSLLRHPDMPEAAFSDLWKTVESGEKWQGYVKNLRKDGRYYWVFATAVPNKRHGEVVGYTSVRRKPSRLKIAESEALYQTLKN